MHNALRSDVHIASGCHLAVLAHAHGVQALPIVGLGVVGNNHAVGHNHTRGILVAGEEAQRMPGVHDQRLLVRHGGEVLHHQPVLGPVLENGTVATVDDELVRMLGHPLVQVVLDHGHDGRRLTALGGVLVDRPGVYFVRRPVAVHVDAAVGFELLGEFRRQLCVQAFRKIAQGIFERQFLLFRLQDILPLGCVVNLRVIGFCLRQSVRNAGKYFPAKIP